MNVEIGAEAALFPEKEYINGMAVAECACLRSMSRPPYVDRRGWWGCRTAACRSPPLPSGCTPTEESPAHGSVHSLKA